MGNGSSELHEEGLPPDVIDRHRAVRSMMEELEAVDWYDQRVHATSDPELAEVLAHNRDEEKEHFAMTLEWLRRRDQKLDEVLRTYLFVDGDVLAVEEAAEHGADAGRSSDLGVGSLRGHDDGPEGAR